MPVEPPGPGLTAKRMASQALSAGAHREFTETPE